MKLLAFDTSSNTLSAALFNGGKKIAQVEADSVAYHSEALWKAVEELIRRSKWEPGDLGAIAVGLGPGSFTGLRVGVAAAKVMAYALGAQLFGISSLAATAWPHLSRHRIVAIASDARKGNVYAAIYERTGGLPKEIMKPCLMNEEMFKARLQKKMFLVDHGSVPSADSVAALAFYKLKMGRSDDPMALAPAYLHAKDCNVTIKKIKK